MKIESCKQKFEPIVITLETYEEAAVLMALCGEVEGFHSIYREATSTIYENLKKLDIIPADVKCSGLEFI